MPPIWFRSISKSSTTTPSRDAVASCRGLRLEVHLHLNFAIEEFLAAADEGGSGHVAEGGRDAAERERAGAAGKRPGAVIGVAAEVPLQAEPGGGEVVGESSVADLLGQRAIGFDLQAHGLAAVDDRPAVLRPLDGRQAGFPADVVHLGIADMAAGEEHDPPAAMLVLDQIRMAGGLERRIDAAVGEDRIMRTGLEGAEDALAAGDGDHMAELRATLGHEQVVPAILGEHVRAFGILAARAAPEMPAFAEQLAGGDVDLRLERALIALRVLRAVADEVGLAVVIEEQRRVDPGLVHPDWVGPLAGRVIGLDVEVAAMGDVGGDHVEPAVVVADGRRVDAAGGAGLVEGKLAFAGQAMADLLPVHQVAAVEDGDAGEVLEAAGDEVEVAADAADGRIGMEAGDDRVVVTGHVVLHNASGTAYAMECTEPSSAPMIRHERGMPNLAGDRAGDRADGAIGGFGSGDHRCSAPRGYRIRWMRTSASGSGGWCTPARSFSGRRSRHRSRRGMSGRRMNWGRMRMSTRS